MKRIIWFSLFVCSTLFAATNAENAFEVELNPAGLSVLADEIRSNYLKALEQGSIPQISDKGPLGIDVSVHGLHYKLSFSSLTIRPANGRLFLDLGLKQVKVSIPTVSLSKKVIFTLGTTCKNIDVELGRSGPIHVSAELFPSVQKEQIAFSASNIHFPIASQNFAVHGPSECSGPLGIGKILSWVAHLALNSAERPIQNILQKKIAEMTPSIAAKVNEMLHQDFPVTIPSNPLLGQKRVFFTPAPYAMRVSPQGVVFQLSVRVSANQMRWGQSSTPWARPGATWLGSLGINPNFPNAFLKTILAQGSKWIELNDDIAPGISSMLSATSLSSFLPDLEVAELSSNSVRAFVQITEAPQFTIGKGATAPEVFATFPKITTRLQIQVEGTWREYFTISATATSGVSLGSPEGDLSFELKDQNQVAITGAWAGSYRPLDPTFDNEGAEMLIASLLDVIHALGPLITIELPVKQIGFNQVTLDEPFIAQPFLKAKIVSID